jgi:hypothetical protein
MLVVWKWAAAECVAGRRLAAARLVCQKLRSLVDGAGERQLVRFSGSRFVRISHAR